MPTLPQAQGPPYESAKNMRHALDAPNSLKPGTRLTCTVFAEQGIPPVAAASHVIRVFRFLEIIDCDGKEIRGRLAMTRLSSSHRRGSLRALVKSAYQNALDGAELQAMTLDWFAGFLASRYRYSPATMRAARRLLVALCEEADIPLDGTFRKRSRLLSQRGRTHTSVRESGDHT